MTDLDDALRSMMQDRAQDIATVPAHVTELPGSDVTRDDRRSRRAPHRTGWLIAASVAAVLAVGGATLALHGSGGDGHRTAPVHTGHPGPTVGSTPTSTPQLSRSTCTVAQPAAWRSAFTRTSTYGAQGATALAFAGTTLVVTRDFGTSRDVALVSSDGTVHRVYTVPDPDKNQVLTAAVDGDHLVIPVSRLPRNANGVIPSVARLDVVDLRTDAVTTVTTAPLHIASSGTQVHIIDAATIYRGTVYYDVRALYTDHSAQIHAYDVATHADRVVDPSGSASPGDGPVVQARGLFWSRNDTAPAIAAKLPSAVDDGLTTARARRTLLTDGTSYAYSPRFDEIAFWAPGMTAPTVYRTQGKSEFPAAVAGRVVIFQDVQGPGGMQALDTRTAAVTSLPTFGPTAITGDHLLVGYPDKSTNLAVRVDTSTLPSLHC